MTLRRFVLDAFVSTVFALLVSAAPQVASADTATDLRCKGCVGPGDLGKKAVRSKAIKNKAVAPRHLADTAKPGGVDFAESVNSNLLDPVLASLISVEIGAPAAGYVTVSSTWYMFATGGNGYASCYITNSEAVGEGPKTVATIVKDEFVPGALTRTFPVASGTTRFHLNCFGAANAFVYEPTMSAMFFPNRY